MLNTKEPDMRPEPCVRRDVYGSVMVIRIVNPARKNALDINAYTLLSKFLAQAEKNAEIKSIVITGHDEYFCSGHDVEDFINNPIQDETHPVFQFMLRMSQCKKPIIAAVEGFAVGIGVTLLLHCDLVYAGRSSFFKMPFTSLGLCPEFAATFIIPNFSTHCIATELLVLGRTWKANRFCEKGFVNELCEDGEAFNTAMKSAEELALLPTESAIRTKQLIKNSFSHNSEKSMREELAQLIELFESGSFTKKPK